MITVEVAYAEQESQALLSVKVPAGTTAIEAVRLSKISQAFDRLHENDALELGIFSRKCEHNTVLAEGDRVEIYRPLLIDPKEARRLKAAVAERKKSQQPAVE